MDHRQYNKFPIQRSTQELAPGFFIAPGETPPSNPEELRKSFFTKRRKDLIEFGYGDSGSTVYFAVQVENGGKKGNWGPMVSVLIP
jgi:hypothetical protein